MKCIIEQNHMAIDLGDNTFTSWELVKPGIFRWINPKDQRITLAYLEQMDQDKKTITFTINGKEITLRYQDQWDELLEKMGFDTADSVQNQPLVAPMPGLVLSVDVAPGDRVQKGQALIKLEAMKMENLLKATSDNLVITKVHVNKGDNVEKNKVLVEFDAA
tara:strand:- start:1039 stop:1524 length:486 start_codon:yes stop_codon:yes gene_type:complete